MNIICFGSSITEAAGFAEEDRWTTRLQRGLDDWRPDTYTVHNRGVGGHTTVNLLDRFENDVRPLLPGVVVLQVGGNDSVVRPWAGAPRVSPDEFRRNLGILHRATTATGGTLVFTTYHRFAQHLIDTYQYRDYARATRAVAEATEAPLIDLYRMMDERGIDPAPMLAPDGIHLTVRGNAEYAKLVLAGLRPILAAL